MLWLAACFGHKTHKVLRHSTFEIDSTTRIIIPSTRRLVGSCRREPTLQKTPVRHAAFVFQKSILPFLSQNHGSLPIRTMAPCT